MKLLSKEEKKTEQEKVDERREEVLAQGRKFKYPLQWTKHRIVVSTILIAVVVVAVVVTSGWLALYRFNMTDDMLFRITKILPVSVATVDGEAVRFSDYLMFYRSSITSIERQSGQVDNEGSVEALKTQYKQSALNEAEKYTYALKLAKENDVTVSSEEVEEEFQRQLKIGGVERSEESFVKIIEDNFGLSKDEYERMLYLTLVKAKVEEKIDKKADELADKVEKMLKENDGNYQAVAEALGDEIKYEETGGYVSSQNIDGGRASEAVKLEPGQQSGKFVSANGDGYYFVKLISKTDTEVNFVSIKVPFTEFKEQFDKLKEDGKITEFITVNPEENENNGQ
ncbi:MAG: SurA N-terminal domain-containing protein [Candidatus Saccharibacteria bacterium]|nr:SurA N-terminal domain-containing protein [Candidatus Saccharibacteria bacterium]